MPSHRILLMRHPETRENMAGVLSGRIDVDLTPRGEEQMRRAIKAVVAWKPDRIWCSPLSRCRSIAEEAAFDLGVPCEVHQNLAEINFGIVQGLRMDEVHRMGYDFPWPLDQEGRSVAAPGAESFEDLLARAGTVLDDLRPLEGRTACISHGGMSRAILGAVFGTPLSTFWHVTLPNVSSQVLTYGNGHFSLAALSLAPEEVARRAQDPSLIGIDTTQNISGSEDR